MASKDRGNRLLIGLEEAARLAGIQIFLYNA
jgi:hypothetical protein